MIDLLILLSPLIAIILIALRFTTKKKEKAKLKKFDQLIQDKKDELALLSSQIEGSTFEKNHSFTKTQMDVLDIYQNSNIRIPSDILEDLYYSKIDDEKETFNYIENQRMYWKLENMKKTIQNRSEEMTQKELQRVLDWMLMMQTITVFQYNELLLKNLPFVK